MYVTKIEVIILLNCQINCKKIFNDYGTGNGRLDPSLKLLELSQQVSETKSLVERFV
jgi:hypothetical protein